MGFVLVGIYAGTEQALQGAVINMLAHGISAGALFILCGEVYERLHTRDLRLMGGLWSRFPFLPPIALFFAAASLGLPGLANFVGEFLILLGTFPVAPVVTVFASTGLIFAAVYSLMFVQRAFYGPVHGDDHKKLEDLNRRELATMLTLMGLLVFFGLYPQPVFELSKAPIQAVQHIYQAAQATVAHTDAGASVAAGGAP
jgi:NADH-quinone oxidoreductase subunit M